MAGKQIFIREIWMLSREYGSLAGAGGVKDVVSQLSVTLAREAGRSVHVVLPCYGFMNPEKLGFHLLDDPQSPGHILQFEVDLNYPEEERREEVRVWVAKLDRVTIYLIDAERFREKQNVYTYTAEEEENFSWQKTGEGHIDYFAMNILLQKAAIDLMILLDARPDIIHCHDGHTAVLPAMISEQSGLRHYFRGTGCVVTVHNAGQGYHQEVADLAFAHASTGLPLSLVRRFRLDDCFDPFLAGAPYAEMNTVSENYARELRETIDDHLTGWLGHTLLERNVILDGITNGIDPDAFSAKDHLKTHIAASFDPLGEAPLEGKRKCKTALLQSLTKDGKIQNVRQSGYLTSDPALPLVTFVGRLSAQKGVAVLTGAIEKLLAERSDFQFLLLGTGSRHDEDILIRLAEKKENIGRVCILCGFDSILANKIYAAGDFFVIPSQYEPCGLTDFMAQLFGNLPIVHSVGGLVKVVDGKTGFSYLEQSVLTLSEAIKWALNLYMTDPAAIRRMQRQAVELIYEQFTWTTVSKKYLELYKRAKKKKIR
ncbi:glycogen synthase [Desulfocapsa sulfexigens DSM 10523]|uniref:starch synthase n=1 Tax=Desulfocapsa sulfexigens (strain DSM 10523 / SB164P1) TaxID=1167006 RepID=M1NEW5_DESSD|nr:glycogen/starch synthase [Desulfocapsa sulfexigens]AGF78244.1 glycogen synthase [Desulfocapsa sulfexigens DSM 10523]